MHLFIILNHSFCHFDINFQNSRQMSTRHQLVLFVSSRVERFCLTLTLSSLLIWPLWTLLSWLNPRLLPLLLASAAMCCQPSSNVEAIWRHEAGNGYTTLARFKYYEVIFVNNFEAEGQEQAVSLYLHWPKHLNTH